MNCNLNRFCVIASLLTAGVSPLFHAEALSTVPAPAPLQKKTVKKAAAKPAKAEVYLDKTNRTFHFGSKRFIFRQNATFSCIASNREILNGYFFVATPFDGWQPNRNCRIQKTYNKTQMNIQEILVDEKARSITWKGVVPFHKKTESTHILRPWQLKAFLTGENKLVMEFKFETPDGKKFRDSGIFINAPGFVSEVRTYPDKKKCKNWYQYATVRLIGEDPKNNMTITGKSPAYTHPFKKKAFRFSPHNLNWRYEFDLGEISGKAVKQPGGVDFKELDALVIPERMDRNLLLNPYLAQGYHYYWTAGQSLAKGVANKVALTTENPLFGKYCLKGPGHYFLNSVPADQGDYVLSFYARGKGYVYLQLSDERSWYNRLTSKTISIDTKGQWKRFLYAFRFPKQGAINWIFSPRVKDGNQLYFDGFQLEKGKTPTPFQAPVITGYLTGKKDAMNLFEDGKVPECFLELSTLSEKSVSGTAEVTVSNFFKEEVLRTKINFSLKNKQFPRYKLPLKKLPQGIYIVKTVYQVKGMKGSRTEFFRFSVMPFLKNQHATAKMYSMTYAGGHGSIVDPSEKVLNRYQQVGVGSFGHAGPFTDVALARYKKYNVIPFDVSCVARTNSITYRKKFPGLKVPDGRTFFYVKNPWFAHWSKDAVLPDYRLVGGWNAQYRKKFVDACVKILKTCPGLAAYGIGSEWPLEIKNDPHYPDLVAAYAEAVRKVYPNAKVYEAGDCNMDITIGVAQLDNLLPRWKKVGFKPDFIGCHFYTKNLPQLYYNLKAFVDVVNKHGYGKTQLAFPEGMHFYPYEIPQWGLNMVEWMGSGWGGGALSYDLGWGEMLSTAYYMRSYLIFLTIFDRTWCVTSSANYINSFFMDLDLTPRGIQKAVNTLGNMLGSPKKFVGDYTFAPESRCLVWIDENNAPVAAVWNEEALQQTGRVKAPLAKLHYKGARFFDMMGAERKANADGTFPLSAFPILIKGKKGDTAAFTKALSQATLLNSNKLPFRIHTEIQPDGKAGIFFKNDLSKTISGTMTMVKNEYSFTLQGGKEQKIAIPLPVELKADRINKVNLLYVCTTADQKVNGFLNEHVIFAKRFKGNWKEIPMIPITNTDMAKKRSFSSAKDFSAAFQIAWDAKNLYLRVTVKDDVFAPGKGKGNRYNDDCVQVYFDTRRSAKKFARTVYDEDDYDYTLMPTMDGKSCEIFRALSPDMQLTLGIAAPKNNEIAKGIPATFTRTKDGYIYEVAFPAWSVLPVKLQKGYNLGFSLYASDRDKDKKPKGGLALTTENGKSPYMKPHLWPLLVLTD